MKFLSSLAALSLVVATAGAAPLTETAPTATDQTVTGPTAPLTETAPTATDPAVTDPAVTNPSATDPAVVDSLSSEPVPMTVDGVAVEDLDKVPHVPGSRPDSLNESGEQKACKTFTDVPANHSFHQYVHWMSCNGLTSGYRDGTFGLNRSMTRGETAMFLYRLSGESHDPGGDPDFTDVAVDSSAFTAVSWMEKKGYSKGYSNGTYRPGQRVSRGELAAFLYRMSGTSYAAPRYTPYRDMGGTTSFYKEAAWLYSTGIITGYEDETFRPTRSITRGESSKFFYSFDQARKGTLPGLTTNRWTTVATPVHAEPAPRTTPVQTLPAQTGVVRLASKGAMTRVRAGTATGWVNTHFLSHGQPGTTRKPFPNGTSYVARASNNIARWCWKVPTTTFRGGGNAYARYEVRGDVNHPSTWQVSEEIELGTLYDADFVPAQAVQLHECAHILQYRAYRYDGAALDKAMREFYPNGASDGVEHMADCMADAMGARRVSVHGDLEWTVGYGGDCTTQQMDAARQVIAGQRPKLAR